MSRPPELSFGDPVVDRAVEVAAASYGDDLMAVFAGVCTRDRRCLSAAASGLHRAGTMSLDEAADALGLSAKSVRVTRHRRMVAFMSAEAAVIADIHGEPLPTSIPGQPVRRQSARPNCQRPDDCSIGARSYGHCRSCEVASREDPRNGGGVAPMFGPPKPRGYRWPKFGPPRPEGLRLRRDPVARAPRPARPVPEAHLRKARFARRFVAAGWPVGETARLFDLKAHELRLALKAEA